MWPRKSVCRCKVQMMKIVVLYLVVQCFSFSSSNEKNYTAVYMNPGTDDSNMTIRCIGNTTECKINGTSTTSSIKIIPTSSRVINTTVSPNTAIFITVTSPDIPHVIGKIESSTAGSDIFMIFENTVLRKKYIAMTYCDATGMCQLAIAATEDDTEVEVTLPEPRLFSNPSCEIDEIDNVTYNSASRVLKVNLSLGSVFQLQAKCDLTGTLIKANKKVAAFSGSHSIVVGWGSEKDFMMEQLIPTEFWGNEYIVYPNPDSYNGDIISILAYEGDTDIRIDSYGRFHLERDRQFIRRRIENDRAIRIWASKSVCVAQYILDFTRKDSAMIFVTPTSQYISKTVTNTEDMVHYIVTNSEQILFPPELSGPGNNERSQLMNVKMSEYYVQKVNVTSNGIYSIEVNDGTMSGYIMSSSTNLQATILNHAFNLTSSKTKSQTPGDGVDNNSNGHVDEDTCDIYTWKSKGDCGRLQPVSDNEIDSFGSAFVIPMVYISDVTVNLTVTVQIKRRNDSVLSISYNRDEEFSDSGKLCISFRDEYVNKPIVVQSKRQESSLYITVTVNDTKNTFAPFPIDALGFEYFAFTNCHADTNCFHVCTVAAFYNDTEIYVENYGNYSLNEKEQYSFYNTSDLTGTYIRSNNPIAVSCGGVEYSSFLSQFQLPPAESWGLQYRIIFNSGDSGVLRFVTSDGNTVVTVMEYEYDGSTTHYTYRTVYPIIDAGEKTNITIENNTAYSINSSKPILVVYLPSAEPYSMVLVSPVGDGIQTVDNFDNCEVETIKEVTIDNKKFYIPYKEINGTLTSWWMKTKVTATPFNVSDSIPGDQKDNDGDGLIDEDFCSFLVTDLDGTAFLFDIDIDGAINEDCRGCPMGEELNEHLACEPCPIGFFREKDGIDKCERCNVSLTTFHKGSNASSYCIDVCLEGYGYNNISQNCTPCNIGQYKETRSDNDTLKFETRWYCNDCDQGKTTIDVATRSSEECREHCKEGYYLESVSPNGECKPCEHGSYKNRSSELYNVTKEERWSCAKCPGNMSTVEEGSTLSSQCAEVCLEGRELDNSTMTCKDCDIGYYKDVNSSDMSVTDVVKRWWCTACTKPNTTMFTGSDSPDQCIENCIEGEEYDAESNTCKDCDFGYYKSYTSVLTNISASLRWNCTQCSAQNTTMQKKSNSSSQCVDRCVTGEEFNMTTSKCDPCPIGYFKNISGNFNSCLICPNNFTTDNEGTKDEGLCRKKGCKCPCNLVSTENRSNFSAEKKAEILDGHKKALYQDKRKLSSAIRKKISAKDDRPSSTAFGGLGIVMISFALALLVFFDITTLKAHTIMFYHNVRAICGRE